MIYLRNLGHRASHANFSLPLSTQVYRAIALLFTIYGQFSQVLHIHEKLRTSRLHWKIRLLVGLAFGGLSSLIYLAAKVYTGALVYKTGTEAVQKFAFHFQIFISIKMQCRLVLFFRQTLNRKLRTFHVDSVLDSSPGGGRWRPSGN